VLLIEESAGGENASKKPPISLEGNKTKKRDAKTKHSMAEMYLLRSTTFGMEGESTEKT